MKIGRRIKRLLFEAYRRNEMRDEFEDNQPLNERWLGLGSKSAYRPALNAGLMVFHDGKRPPPRCMGWLCLTKAGIVAMKEHETEFKQILEEAKRHGYNESCAANYTLCGGIVAE